MLSSVHFSVKVLDDQEKKRHSPDGSNRFLGISSFSGLDSVNFILSEVGDFSFLLKLYSLVNCVTEMGQSSISMIVLFVCLFCLYDEISWTMHPQVAFLVLSKSSLKGGCLGFVS